MSNHVTVQRLEDMSPGGFLQVTFQGDGDVIVQVNEDRDEPIARIDGVACVEFCTLAGGGKSKRTIKALRELALAIWQDNNEEETRRGRISQDIRPWFPSDRFEEVSND